MAAENKKDGSRNATTDKTEGSDASKSDVKPVREISGNLPYSPSPSSIPRILDAIVQAERPEKFTNNYMETVLSLSGGGVRSVPPLLKKMGFLLSDGTPAELYSKFKTESGRPQAALQGLKNAFSDIFRKNEFAHKATEAQLIDVIVEITGLTKNDPVTRHIFNSFSRVRDYIPMNFNAAESGVERNPEENPIGGHPENGSSAEKKISLSYQINIVLPETQDQLVYDAIFKSLNRNLLS